MPWTVNRERTKAAYVTSDGRAGSAEVPTVDQLDRWSTDSVCEALDGCTVEHDGVCEHGLPSWLLALGYV